MDFARRGFFGWFGTVSLLVAVATFVIGCGGSVIDSAKMEDTLRHNLEAERKEKVSSVSCPSGQEVEPKATFQCTIDLADGTTKVATIEIRNDEADVSVVRLQEEGSGANE
jgi:hypothetical protein